MQSKFWPVYSFVITGLFCLAALMNGNVSIQKAKLMEDKKYLIEQLSDKLLKLETFEQHEQVEKSSIKNSIVRLNPFLSPDLLGDSVEAIYNASKEFSVDQELLIAIVHKESNFDPKAVSTRGALGLMQVMPLWVKEIEFINSNNDLLNPRKNVRAGAYIFSKYLVMFHGDKRMALLAYNRGPGTVINALHAGENPDNGYPSVILASYERVRH